MGPHVRLLRPYIDVAYVYHSHPSRTCYISLQYEALSALARLPVVFMLFVGITSTSRRQSLLNSEIQLQQRFNLGPSRSSTRSMPTLLMCASLRCLRGPNEHQTSHSIWMSDLLPSNGDLSIAKFTSTSSTSYSSIPSHLRRLSIPMTRVSSIHNVEEDLQDIAPSSSHCTLQ